MLQRMVITQRDAEVITALTQKTRLFSQQQLAQEWWNCQTSNARRRLQRLCEAKLVNEIIVVARRLPVMNGPVVSWKPGEPAPGFGHVSYVLQSRWRNAPVRQTVAFVATKRGAKLFGGKAQGVLKNGSQATHDLGVSAVWLWYRAHAPVMASAWLGEDLMADTRAGQKLPDSFILGEDGETKLVIEFGGSYDANRVRAFHDDAEDRGLAYQIW